MADPKAPSAGKQTRAMMDALTLKLPAFMEVINSQEMPRALTELGVAQKISPEMRKLETELYQRFAPMLAQTGRDIDAENRKASSRTDAEILDTSGRDLARTYKQIDEELNPEFYKTRASAATSIDQLLKAINLDDPNIEAERLISQENARSGNDSAESTISTTANALNFGAAKQGRMAALSNAINTATNFLQPSTNAQFNPATASLNRPTSNTGLSQFGGVSGSSGVAANLGNGMKDTVAGFQSQAADINANRRDILDKIHEGIGSINS